MADSQSERRAKKHSDAATKMGTQQPRAGFVKKSPANQTELINQQNVDWLNDRHTP